MGDVTLCGVVEDELMGVCAINDAAGANLGPRYRTRQEKERALFAFFCVKIEKRCMK